MKSVSLFAYENVLDLQRRMLPGVFPGGTLDFKWQGWSNGGKIQNPKKSHAEYLSSKNFQRNYANYAGYTGTIMNLHIVLNTLKNPFLNQATQKNSCQNFLPEKIPKLKISNPPKSFNHPCHLKSRVAPWECLDQVQSTWFVGCLKQALKILQLCLVYCSSRMLNGSSRLIFTTLKTL